MAIKRKGMKLVFAPDGSEKVVSVINWRDKVIIATTEGVYSYPHEGDTIQKVHPDEEKP